MGTGDPNSCQHRRYVTHGAISSPCRAIFCEILIWQPVFCLCSPIVSIMSRYVHMSTVVLSEHLLCAFHPDENYDSLGPDPALPASLALLYLLEAHQLWWSRGGAGAQGRGRCHSPTTVPTALSQAALHTGISSLASLPPPPAASWKLLETAGCHSFWDFRMIDSCLE